MYEKKLSIADHILIKKINYYKYLTISSRHIGHLDMYPKKT